MIAAQSAGLLTGLQPALAAKKLMARLVARMATQVDERTRTFYIAIVLMLVHLVMAKILWRDTQALSTQLDTLSAFGLAWVLAFKWLVAAFLTDAQSFVKVPTFSTLYFYFVVAAGHNTGD